MRRLLGGVAVAAAAVVIVVLAVAGIHRQPHHAGLTAGGASPPAAANPGVRVGAATLAASGRAPAALVAVTPGLPALFATAGCSTTGRLYALTHQARRTVNVAPPARHLLQLSVSTGGVITAVGAGSKCVPRSYSSRDGGAIWTPHPHAPTGWLALPRGVRSPAGRLGDPCGSGTRAPVAVAGAGRRTAVVVCGVGVYRTTDGGRTWVPAGDLPYGRPVDVALTARGRGVLLLDGEGYCLGLRVMRTTDAGRSWTSGACLTTAQTPAAVGVDTAGDGLVVATGARYLSSDRGRRWSRVRGS